MNSDRNVFFTMALIVFAIVNAILLSACEVQSPSEVIVQTKMDCFTYSLKAIDTEYHPGQRIPALCDQT